MGTIFSHAPNNEIWSPLNGQAGVVAFFVLSGFLITTLASREEFEYGFLNFRAFFIRRAFRLFPAYYLVLGLYCIFIFELNQKGGRSAAEFKESLWHFVFYLQEYARATSYYQTWSLGIEEKFYLVWPLVAFGLCRGLYVRWIWAFTIVFSLIVLASFFSHLIQPFPYFTLLMGSLAAVLLSVESTYNIVVPILRRFALPCLAALISCHFIAPHYREITVLLVVTPIFMAGVLISIVTGGLPKLVGILEFPLLVRLGKYSYFIYLIHLLVKGFVVTFQPTAGNVWIDSFLTIIFTTALSYSSASLVFRYFEEPLINLGRQFSNRYRGSLPPVH